jgi:hypothetical protein
LRLEKAHRFFQLPQLFNGRALDAISSRFGKHDVNGKNEKTLKRIEQAKEKGQCCFDVFVHLKDKQEASEPR